LFQLYIFAYLKHIYIMRIAFVTSEYPIDGRHHGGLGNYLQRTALALLQLGHEAVVITAAESDGSIIQSGVPVELVDTGQRAMERWFGRCTRHGLSMTTALVRLRRRLRQRLDRLHQDHPFDVVQYPHLAALALGRRIDVPCIVRLSGYQRLWQKAGDGEASWWKGWQQGFLEDRAIKRGDLVFGPSRVIVDHVQEKLDIPIEVMENPFVLESVEADAAVVDAVSEGRPFLLFVGSLVPVKGVHAMAGALAKILSQYPELLVVFIGAERGGINNRSTRDFLTAAAGPNGARLRFPGVLGHRQLYPFYSRAAAVWLPSRIDNLPNTCLEAMAHGCVVIGTRGASFEQLIDDGVSGFLCEIDNAQDLAQTVLRALVLNPAQREHMGMAAQARIAQMRPEVTGNALIEFYQRAIAIHRQRRSG